MTLVFLALILFIWLYAYSILSKESIEKRYRKQQKEREACILAEAMSSKKNMEDQKQLLYNSYIQLGKSSQKDFIGPR